jgi:hypothetical protein
VAQRVRAPGTCAEVLRTSIQTERQRNGHRQSAQGDRVQK